MPLLVISVTGNQTAKAIRNTFAPCVVGKVESASGIQAVVGIGPMTFVIGVSQYATGLKYPSARPVKNPTTAPQRNPVTSSPSESPMFSSRNPQFSTSRPIMRSRDGK